MSTNTTREGASQSRPPKKTPPPVNFIASGIVVAILKRADEGAIPHALLVEFDGHIGMLRARDLEDEQRILRIARGAKITAIVTKTGIDKKGKPFIDLSEKKLQMLTELFSLRDSKVVGTITKCAPFGIFVDIGDGFPYGLCRTNELAAANQRDRLRSLKAGDKLSVVVTGIDPDPNRIGEYQVTLSEVKRYVDSETYQRFKSLG
jgi:small subunit ribosomal protein S1